MPHFMNVLIPYINLLNLSWIKTMSIFEEYGAFNKYFMHKLLPVTDNCLFEPAKMLLSLPINL